MKDLKHKGVGRRRERKRLKVFDSARLPNESRQICGMANLLESVNILSFWRHTAIGAGETTKSDTVSLLRHQSVVISHSESTFPREV